MLIGVKNKFVFIANSKASSTSIETALRKFAEVERGGSPRRKHIQWREAREEYAFLFDCEGHTPERFFRFGVVRDPVSWVVSWYNYRLGSRRVRNALPADMTFEQFWRRDDWVKRASQRAHFVDSDGTCRFDLIVPLDALDRAFPTITRFLGLPAISLPKKNVSRRGGLAVEDLEHGMVADIERTYPADLAFHREWCGRVDNVLDALAGGTRAARKERAAGHTNGEIVVSSEKPSLVAVQFVDKRVSEDDLHGVVVLQPNAQGNFGLVARDGAGEHPVEWGLASPARARQHPDNPFATNARFRVKGLRIEDSSPVELYLTDASGERFRLFVLSRNHR
jgi:hypothetical protein